MKEKIIDFSNGIFSYDRGAADHRAGADRDRAGSGKRSQRGSDRQLSGRETGEGHDLQPGARADFSEVLVLWKSRKAGIYVLCRASAAGRDLYRISLDRIQCGRI